MLDQLPADVWSSPTTTFLDPCMCGGQFLAEIERRLRAAGHSDANIAERVWGCEINKLRVNYSRNNKKLVSNHLVVCDVLSYNWADMKFDVVVGNPPYQNPNKSSDKIWPHFVQFAFNMAKTDGYVGLVTPNGWFLKPDGQKFKPISSLFLEHRLQHVNLDATGYFPGIGEKIGWWVAQKSPNIGSSTSIVHNKVVYNRVWTGSRLALTARDQTVGEIIEKFLANATPHILYHDYAHNINTQDLLEKKIIRVSKTKTHSCEIFWSASQTMWGKSSDVYKGWKVIVNTSGHYYSPHNPTKYITYSNTLGVGQLAFGIKCQTEDECKNMVSYLTSKLYVWYMAETRTNGWNHNVRKLPKLDTSMQWTDQLVYSHFGLSAEEIELVDTVFK
jgi:site-specific DNA-methyltransferase (adenine-specific)